MEKWVVSIGNAFDGLTLYGPFNTEEEAFDWAVDSKHEWVVIKLFSPRVDKG